jgi:hypothetical protein
VKYSEGGKQELIQRRVRTGRAEELYFESMQLANTNKRLSVRAETDTVKANLDSSLEKYSPGKAMFSWKNSYRERNNIPCLFQA